jgi:broad specificity phosphatase PhoE
MKLYLVRHGFAYHNLAVNKWGDKGYFMKEYEGMLLTDALLTGKGIVQATDLKEKLNNIKFKDIYCSSSSRCIQTCDFSIDTNLIIKLDDRLMEPQGIHICNKRKIKNDISNFLLSAKNKFDFFNVTDNYDDRFNNPESNEEFTTRIKNFINHLKNNYENEDNILIITHYDWLFHFYSILYNIPYGFNNCELKIIDL